MKYILKSIFRNFSRKPASNFINLLGLAVSLALVIILAVYCYSELTTDYYQKNVDRTYLCIQKDEMIHTTFLLKNQIDLSVPSVKQAIRVGRAWETSTFQVEDKDPINSNLFFTDSGFFDLFSYKAISGDLVSALNEPLTLVITRPFAEKLFGSVNIVGKTVKYNNDKLFTIKAVVEVPKGNSVISFNALTSMDTKKIIQLNKEEFSQWGWASSLTFVCLKEDVKADLAAKNILSVIPKGEQYGYTGIKLISLKELYFMKAKSRMLNFGDKQKVMILLIVACLILVIALVNFINISSAQWFEKIRQTGVMKVIGATRSTILRNVLFESFFFFLTSLFIAVIIALVSVSFINNYTGIQINKGLLLSPLFILISMVTTLVLSIMFSLIPALRISSSSVMDNLKKSLTKDKSNSTSKAILVITQFTIAIVLVAFTVLVQKQINFGSSNFGMNQENIIGIKLTKQLDEKKGVLKHMLEQQPGMGEVSFSQYYPGESTLDHLIMDSDTKGEKKHYDFDTFCADENFLRLIGLQLIQGRFYSDSLSSDGNKAVVNETFVRNHKLEEPIGEKIMTMTGESEIIGVMKDFHYRPFSEPIAALAIRNAKVAKYCLVKFKSTDFNSLQRTIQQIKTLTTQLSPSFPVEISFLDQAVEQMYNSEFQFRRTFSLFAACAIVICCMGIFAMSLFACQRRIKEISIRKVNGATSSEVMIMLNKDFVKWVTIAFILATPVAWYAMHKWLENFAYKTELSWWIFALAGLIALVIALLTVSWQSWKAATSNPVEALRSE